MIIKTNKNKINNNIKLVIILAIIGVFMIANILLITKIVNSKNKEKEVNTSSEAGENANENSEESEPEISLDEELRQMSETQRMKRYVGVFFENIENGRYQEAYDVLNKDFKTMYFGGVEDFTAYAKKYFNPSTMVVTYDNIERLGNNKTGNMYVLWLTIGNLFQPKLAEDEEIEQTNFVIVEYDYNNYEMSFSVQGVEEE